MPVVVPATMRPLRHIIANMREADRIEFACCREDMQPDHVAASIMARGVYRSIVHTDDNEPVAAIGAVPMWRGVCAMWAFGTERWPEVILTLTKHAQRVMVPQLLAAGYHRAEARALADRADVDKWLRHLGFKAEGRLTGFGSGREDFMLYAWTDAPEDPKAA